MAQITVDEDAAVAAGEGTEYVAVGEARIIAGHSGEVTVSPDYGSGVFGIAF